MSAPRKHRVAGGVTPPALPHSVRREAARAMTKTHEPWARQQAVPRALFRRPRASSLCVTDRSGVGCTCAGGPMAIQEDLPMVVVEVAHRARALQSACRGGDRGERCQAGARHPSRVRCRSCSGRGTGGRHQSTGRQQRRSAARVGRALGVAHQLAGGSCCSITPSVLLSSV